MHYCTRYPWCMLGIHLGYIRNGRSYAAVPIANLSLRQRQTQDLPSVSCRYAYTRTSIWHCCMSTVQYSYILYWHASTVWTNAPYRWQHHCLSVWVHRCSCSVIWHMCHMSCWSVCWYSVRVHCIPVHVHYTVVLLWQYYTVYSAIRPLRHDADRHQSLLYATTTCITGTLPYCM